MPYRPYRDSQALVAMARILSGARAEHDARVDCTVGDLSSRLYCNAHLAPKTKLRL